MDDRAVSTVQTVLAETRWLSTPCPTEYLPALARDILWALEKAGFGVAQLQPEWAIRSGITASRSMSEAAAKARAERWPESFEAVTRLASPWVPVVTTPQEQPRDADGNPICTECSMPEPAEWCWQQSVSCPFGKPPRSNP